MESNEYTITLTNDQMGWLLIGLLEGMMSEQAKGYKAIPKAIREVVRVVEWQKASQDLDNKATV